MSNAKNLTMTLQSLRKDRDLTQREVAIKLGVSETSVRNWEKGRTSIALNHVFALINLLGCSAQDIHQAMQNSGCPIERGKKADTN